MKSSFPGMLIFGSAALQVMSRSFHLELVVLEGGCSGRSYTGRYGNRGSLNMGSIDICAFLVP